MKRKYFLILSSINLANKLYESVEISFSSLIQNIIMSSNVITFFIKSTMSPRKCWLNQKNLKKRKKFKLCQQLKKTNYIMNNFLPLINIENIVESGSKTLVTDLLIGHYSQAVFSMNLKLTYAQVVKCKYKERKNFFREFLSGKISLFFSMTTTLLWGLPIPKLSQSSLS